MNNKHQIQSLQCTVTSCNISPSSQTVTQGTYVVINLSWTGGAPPYDIDWYNENGYWTSQTGVATNSAAFHINPSGSWSSIGVLPATMPLGTHYFFANIHCPGQPSCRAPSSGWVSATANAAVSCANPTLNLAVS